jgi:hypothetical protein
VPGFSLIGAVPSAAVGNDRFDPSGTSGQAIVWQVLADERTRYAGLVLRDELYQPPDVLTRL